LPALECAKCHAINLDARVTKSDTDRAQFGSPSDGRIQAAGMPTTRTSDGLSPAEVDSVVSEVDVALAEPRFALEFLEKVTDGETGKAVADAQHAVQRIETLVEDPGRRCPRGEAWGRG
jgi:hypothetical protein